MFIRHMGYVTRKKPQPVYTMLGNYTAHAISNAMTTPFCIWISLCTTHQCSKLAAKEKLGFDT